MRASVEVIRDGASVRNIPIPMGATMVFGRSPKVQVSIDDPSLSRRHLMIKFDDSGLVVTDMGSSNHTFVNGIQVQSQKLKSGDLISLGYVILRVYLEEEGAVTAAVGAPFNPAAAMGAMAASGIASSPQVFPPQPPSSKLCQSCGKALPADARQSECERCAKAKQFDQWVKNYQLLRPLGEGPRGWVYLARNAQTNANCTVKVIKTPKMADEDAQRLVPQIRPRLMLAAPGAVKPLEVDSWNGLIFFATEFIDGGSLQAYLKNYSKIEERQAICFMIDLLPALAYGAARGVIHGGVQPANILYDRRGWSYLCDFGQAVCFHKLVPNSIVPSPYTAPEFLANPAEADARADIYALGMTAYHAVVGNTEIPRGHDSGMLGLRCSPQLAYIVQRSTDPDPNLRYRTPQEMLDNIFTLFPGSEARKNART